MRTTNFKFYDHSSNFKELELSLGDSRLRIWISYDSIIAFLVNNESATISENAWYSTTGKHLNKINRDKTIRIPREEFLIRFRMALIKFCISVSTSCLGKKFNLSFIEKKRKNDKTGSTVKLL